MLYSSDTNYIIIRFIITILASIILLIISWFTSRSTFWTLLIIFGIVFGIFILCIIGYYLFRIYRRKHRKIYKQHISKDNISQS